MLGHLASSQTVCNLLSLTADFVWLKIACCSPVGKLVLNHFWKAPSSGFNRLIGRHRELFTCHSFLPLCKANLFYDKRCINLRYFVHFLKTRFIDIKQRGNHGQASSLAQAEQIIADNMRKSGGKRIGAKISKLLIDSGFFVLIHVNNSVWDSSRTNHCR